MGYMFPLVAGPGDEPIVYMMIRENHIPFLIDTGTTLSTLYQELVEYMRFPLTDRKSQLSGLDGCKPYDRTSHCKV